MSENDIIKKNIARKAILFADYDPLLGIGSPIARFPFKIILPGEDKSTTFELPMSMLDTDLVKLLQDVKSFKQWAILVNGVDDINIQHNLFMLFTRLRFKHDFEYWAFLTVKIQDKLTKKVIRFVLRLAQRILLEELEDMRMAGIPIRLILLKARQYGGSTLIQIYMLWIQNELMENWHSAICADDEGQSRNIRGMYDRAAKEYPKRFGTISLVPYQGSSKNKIVRERGCIIGIGSMQMPDNLRSYDFSMLHLSEIGIWKETIGKKPEDLTQTLRSALPDLPMTLEVLESTAKGVGNFFHREWLDAKTKTSGYRAVFVPWYMIDIYVKPIKDLFLFIKTMTPYDLFQWECGATLEGINWYKNFKANNRYSDWRMQSEFPTTDIEAFQSTGARVFAPSYVHQMRKYCYNPEYIGQLFASGQKGKEAFTNIEFKTVAEGNLWIWTMPDKSMNIDNRYIVTVDIGGRTEKADFSTVRVLDRYWLLQGGVPEMVATWKGHCFVPGTMIYTSTGFVKIEDVKIGSLVWTHKNRFRKVLRTYKQEYSGGLISMRAQGNYETVRCTPEHPFFSNNVSLKVKRRRKTYNNRKCYSYGKTEKIGETKWTKAEDLKYIAFSKNKNCRKAPSPFIISKYNGGKSKNTLRTISDFESLFSVLGYYLAEGHVGRRSTDNEIDKITFSFGYKEINTHVKDCYDKLVHMGFSPRIKEHKNRGVCLLIVGDKYFASLIFNLCGGHSWGKMISPVILNYPKHLLKILLDSYWKGDGSSYYTDDTLINTITTVSPILARQIRDILILLDHRPGIYRVDVKTKVFKSSRPRYNIVWTASRNKKYPLLQDSNAISYKIKSKTTEQYKGLVYNLEVEEDNSYSTESYIVHNCDQDMFAWVAARIAKFYNNALFIVESNSLRKETIASEGDHYLTILDEIAEYYDNVFTRVSPEKVRGNPPVLYGLHMGQNKVMIIDAYNGALRDIGYIERDVRVLDECDSFEYKSDGTMGAVDGTHDDLVIPSAMAIWASESPLAIGPVREMESRTLSKKNKIISEASI